MERKYNKQPKFHIRKGDMVKVIAGDDKGKTGKVMEVITDKSRAVVEGVNMMTKHQKPSAGKPEGGIKKIEGTLHISNLMLVDPASGIAIRTGRKLNEKGKLQRYSKKTGGFIK
ncbi:MAG TPA: 50S ribosomal protein L24 [Cyclobacteriaceae bacterium]|jgi:large subunit ribosomal protein L24|nr:50S ribosomal protein L24 [Cyclobacteriaceae bacterium]